MPPPTPLATAAMQSLKLPPCATACANSASCRQKSVRASRTLGAIAFSFCPLTFSASLFNA